MFQFLFKIQINHWLINIFYLGKYIFRMNRTQDPEFFLYQVSLFPLRRLSFQPNLRGKSMFSPLVNIFLTKTCISVHTTHSSVNFTWFALLSHQECFDRQLFKAFEINFKIFFARVKIFLL